MYWMIARHGRNSGRVGTCPTARVLGSSMLMELSRRRKGAWGFVAWDEEGLQVQAPWLW
jgi:hypothetical protein